MDELVTAVPTGLVAFTATNIDDVVMLTLFFSQVNAVFRSRHVVVGQYLGFGALVVASLPGFFGGLIVPRAWIGMLGAIPIAFGISRLLNTEAQESEVEITQSDRSTWLNFLSPQAFNVAAVTVANGSDNISIYAPLFASSSLESLLVILSTFFLMVGVWCVVAYKLTRMGAIADTLTRYGNYLAPFVLIGLGVLILVDSHVLESPGLTTIALVAGCFCLLTLFRNERSPEVEKN
ncbi:MAG TPA: cadmium resistance transporter [Leptolyngbyaceae cyanobacterium]